MTAGRPPASPTMRPQLPAGGPALTGLSTPTHCAPNGHFVGRVSELATFTNALTAVVGGRAGRVVFVEGHAGVGKTRLLEEGMEHARRFGMRVISAKGEDPDSQNPLRLLDDLLRLTAEGNHRTGHSNRADRCGGRGRCTASDDRLEVLVRRCSTGPTLLVIDDLQWADAASVTLLCRLAARIDRLPLVLVGATRCFPRRPELDLLIDRTPGAIRAFITIRPLTLTSVDALVDLLTAGRSCPTVVSRVAAAGGVPALVAELIESAAAADAPGGCSTPVPVSFLRRRSVISPETIDILSMASVIGPQFSLRDLSLLLGRRPVELWPAVREAVLGGVLSENGERLAFCQQLVYEALYAEHPATVRKALQLEFGWTLAATDSVPTRAAGHLAAGADPGDARVIGWLRRAAARVSARSPDTATAMLQAGVDLAPLGDPCRGQLLLDLALSLVRAGRPGEAARVCLEASSGDYREQFEHRIEARMGLLLVQALVMAGRAEKALDGWVAEPWQGWPPVPRCRARAWYALACFLCGDMESAEREATAALVESTAAEDAPGTCQGLVTQARVLSARGHFAEALTAARRAAEVAESSRGLDVALSLPHLHLGSILTRLGVLHDAVSVIERGRRLTMAAGLACFTCLHDVGLQYARFESGRWAEVAAYDTIGLPTEGYAERALETLRVRIAMEQRGLAEEHPSAAKPALQPHGFVPLPAWGPVLEALALEARGRAAQGRAAQGLVKLKAAWDDCRARGAVGDAFGLGEDLVRLAVGAGDDVAAEETTKLMEEVAAANSGLAGVGAIALRCRGLLERDPTALSSAADAFEEAGHLFRYAGAAEDTGEALLHRGRHDEAVRRFEDALAVYETLEASRAVARVRARLRGIGVRHGARGPRPRVKDGWGALTGAELKVVELVAERLSNPQIAERLFVSRRTVQTHVSHILRKLGLKSRGEIAVEVRRRLEATGSA